MAVDDMPDIPASEEKIELPDVPTKTPVAADAVAENAEASSNKKGTCLTHMLMYAPTQAPTHEHYHNSISNDLTSFNFWELFSVGGAVASMTIDELNVSCVFNQFWTLANSSVWVWV